MNKHILIVEDEQILRDLISSELEKDGYTTSVASNGYEALNILQLNGQIDLILSDLQMPELDGYQLIREARNLESYQAKPIIVLSNSGYVEDLNRARALGATDVLVKADFTPAMLVSKVTTCLRRVTEES
jgi:CheY-like chemotaxis protein